MNFCVSTLLFTQMPSGMRAVGLGNDSLQSPTLRELAFVHVYQPECEVSPICFFSGVLVQSLLPHLKLPATHNVRC